MDRRIETVIALLKMRPLASPPPLDELARSVNLSGIRLRVLFKAETGFPLAQYIHRLRMEKAKELAENTHLSIKQIVAQIWAGDEGHFLRHFKKTYGLTLSECRRRRRSEVEEEGLTKYSAHFPGR
jgi:AraC-like DNA-binding protein